MMQVAVNCLVKEASRKSVTGLIRARVRRSVTPYPRRNTGLPLLTTRTAAPGALVDFNDSNTASIWLLENWAEAEAQRMTHETRKASGSRVFTGNSVGISG